jgi:hypothetical protein
MNSNSSENPHSNLHSINKDIDNYNKTTSILNFTEENITSILHTINTNQNFDTLNSFNNSPTLNKKSRYKNTEDIPILYTDPFNFSEKSKKKEVVKKNIYERKSLRTEKVLKNKAIISGNKK